MTKLRLNLFFSSFSFFGIFFLLFSLLSTPFSLLLLLPHPLRPHHETALLFEQTSHREFISKIVAGLIQTITLVQSFPLSPFSPFKFLCNQISVKSPKTLQPVFLLHLPRIPPNMDSMISMNRAPVTSSAGKPAARATTTPSRRGTCLPTTCYLKMVMTRCTCED